MKRRIVKRSDGRFYCQSEIAPGDWETFTNYSEIEEAKGFIERMSRLDHVPNPADVKDVEQVVYTKG